jgi:hypothetical protein
MRTAWRAVKRGSPWRGVGSGPVASPGKRRLVGPVPGDKASEAAPGLSKQPLNQRKFESKNRPSNPCGTLPMKDSPYCWRHTFGKVRKVPWWKNATFHTLALGLILPLGLHFQSQLTGPTKENQENTLAGQTGMEAKLDRILEFVHI